MGLTRAPASASPGPVSFFQPLGSGPPILAAFPIFPSRVSIAAAATIPHKYLLARHVHHVATKIGPARSMGAVDRSAFGQQTNQERIWR